MGSSFEAGVVVVRVIVTTTPKSTFRATPAVDHPLVIPGGYAAAPRPGDTPM
jgi:hypothetical protein